MTMQVIVSATEARVHFGELMQDAVQHQQPIVVEKAGKPQVVIIAYDRYRQLVREENDDWRTLLARGHANVNSLRAGRDLPSAVEMIEEGRRARDEELSDLR
jgi:prevent-host-death family protein